MPKPNGGLITETNAQYFAGAQKFISDGTGVFTTTFNTNLIFASHDPASVDYTLNNFVIYTSTTNMPGSYTRYILPFTVVENTITITASPAVGVYVVVQLKDHFIIKR